MWRWIVLNAVKFVCAVAVGLPMMYAYLKRKAAKELYLPVVNKLNQPLSTVSAGRMPRKDTWHYAMHSSPWQKYWPIEI